MQKLAPLLLFYVLSIAPPLHADVSAVPRVGEVYGSELTALDSDRDGLSDERELELGTDYTRADSDGDGWPDGAEVDAGTDPLGPGQKPASVTIAVPRSRITVPGFDGSVPGEAIFKNGFNGRFGEVVDGRLIRLVRPGLSKAGVATSVTVATPTAVSIDWDEKP